MALSMKLCAALLFVCSLVVQATVANKVICDTLPKRYCPLSVSSSGSRCMLENGACKESEIVSNKFSGHIESDECMSGCGLEREDTRLSSDLLSPEFTSRLCNPACYQNCANIVDFYSGLAAVEGLSLAAMCRKVNSNAIPPVSSVGDRRAALGLVSTPAPAPVQAAFVL